MLTTRFVSLDYQSPADMAAKYPVPSQKEGIKKLLECAICLEEYKDPRLLSCGHVLCYMCVKSYLEKSECYNKLSCPTCRGLTDLYEGGVDNLPKFFFAHDLKELALDENDENKITPQPDRPTGPLCSSEDCDEEAVNFCQKGCDFLCEQCYDGHSRSKFSKSHKVIPASEQKRLCEIDKPPYPACHRHKHQILDLYCRTCRFPVCVTCSQGDHRSHDCCDIEKQADVCKTKLQRSCKDTDRLIDQVKQAVDKTKSQVQRAERDINDACQNVKSTFKIMRENLDKEEKSMLSDLQDVRKRTVKISDVTEDNQMMILASLENLKICQTKLVDKDSVYDNVTVTDCIETALEKYHGQHLSSFDWSSQFAKCENGEQPHVLLKQYERSKIRSEVREVHIIHMHNQSSGVFGLVVHRNHIYTVHYTGLTVYCYIPSGVLSCKYEHKDGANISVQGMCLMINEDKSMLVVSDWTNKCLVWITISDDLTMRHHHTKQLEYEPSGLYDDNGVLMVCCLPDNEIHRYRNDGEPLDVITLPDDTDPFCVTRQSELYYVAGEKQLLMITKDGRVKNTHKDAIHGVTLGDPYQISTDSMDRVLVCDLAEDQVLLISNDGDEVVQLLNEQHVEKPTCLSLNADQHKLYVSGRDHNEEYCIFIYDYSFLTGLKAFTEIVNKFELIVEL